MWKTIGRFLFPGFLAFSLWLALPANTLAKNAPQSALGLRPYRFDVGAIDSGLSENTLPLTPKHKYKKNPGYGWTSSPGSAFFRDELSRSRDAFLIDGIAADQIDFQADIPSGDWWVTAWIDAGYETESTMTVSLEGIAYETGWHRFTPEEEPGEYLQRFYRVFQGKVAVSDDGLQLKLTGGKDKVRLLGLSLIPVTPATTERQIWIEKRMMELGCYGSPFPLTSLQADLALDLFLDPNDAFAAYWLQQVELLQKAEAVFVQRGWEWAKIQTGMHMFGRYNQAITILDVLLSQPEAVNPFYERALWQRGRVLHWLSAEGAGPNETLGSQRDLGLLYARYPEDPLLAMYNGKKIDEPDPADNLVIAPNAPAWSAAQYEALTRMANLAHWWVEERQIPNGELGGKYGDDVEILRWWPSLVLTGDTIAFDGWKRLADGVWNSWQVYKGFARRVSDVEHASEFISDTATLMVLYSDDPIYVERLRYSADHMENLWSGITPKGHRLFKSGWFSSTEVNTDPPRNRDVEMNARAVKAVRYLAWKTGDPEVIDLLHEWSRTWLRAAMSTDKGKPAGIVPPSIRFPDESINGDEPHWYEANLFWDYLDWHGDIKMLDQFLFTYTLTGDKEMLQPLLAALDLIARYKPELDQPDAVFEKGSPRWAAQILDKRAAFWSVVTQWRILTGDTRYDDLIVDRGASYAKYRITGNEDFLAKGIQPVLDTLRYNTPMLTTEILFTDRVYITADPNSRDGEEHIKAMLTGDAVKDSMSPYPAVSWEGTGPGFTALVADNTAQSLTIKIFSHDISEQHIRMRTWQLEAGDYILTVSTPQGKNDSRIHIKERGQRISFTLSPQILAEVSLKKL